MPTERREFLRTIGKAGLGMTGVGKISIWSESAHAFPSTPPPQQMMNESFNTTQPSVIGNYGPWAASLNNGTLPALSFRQKERSDLDAWKKIARKRVMELMAIPNIGGLPPVSLKRKFEYDGLHVEELTWQLPYGRPT